jgi:hypothetical protein
LGAAFGDAAGERHPPNATRTKHVPQTLDRRPLGTVCGTRLEML